MFEKLQKAIDDIRQRKGFSRCSTVEEFAMILMSVSNALNVVGTSHEEAALWATLISARHAVEAVVERHRCEVPFEPTFDCYGDVVEAQAEW